MSLLVSKNMEPFKMGIKINPPSLQLFYKLHPKDRKKRRYQIFLQQLAQQNDAHHVTQVLFNEHEEMLKTVDYQQIQRMVQILLTNCSYQNVKNNSSVEKISSFNNQNPNNSIEIIDDDDTEAYLNKQKQMRLDKGKHKRQIGYDTMQYEFQQPTQTPQNNLRLADNYASTRHNKNNSSSQDKDSSRGNSTANPLRTSNETDKHALIPIKSNKNSNSNIIVANNSSGFWNAGLNNSGINNKSIVNNLSPNNSHVNINNVVRNQRPDNPFQQANSISVLPPSNNAGNTIHEFEPDKGKGILKNKQEKNKSIGNFNKLNPNQNQYNSNQQTQMGRQDNNYSYSFLENNGINQKKPESAFHQSQNQVQNQNQNQNFNLFRNQKQPKLIDNQPEQIEFSQDSINNGGGVLYDPNSFQSPTQNKSSISPQRIKNKKSNNMVDQGFITFEDNEIPTSNQQQANKRDLNLNLDLANQMNDFQEGNNRKSNKMGALKQLIANTRQDE